MEASSITDHTENPALMKGGTRRDYYNVTWLWDGDRPMFVWQDPRTTPTDGSSLQRHNSSTPPRDDTEQHAIRHVQGPSIDRTPPEIQAEQLEWYHPHFPGQDPRALPTVGQVSHTEGNNKASDHQEKGKSEMTGCHRFLRYATFIFTFVIFLAGAGVLGLGIYILGSDYGAKQVSEILGNDLYLISAYILVGSGSALILISMCGCCGAQRESKIMLGLFIFAIAVLVICLVIVAILVFVFRKKMEGDIVHSMEDILIKKYGVDLHHSENRMITDMWNWLQKELQCCGVTGKVNSTTSWAIYKLSHWYKGFQTGKPYVPQTCCNPDGNINQCTGIVEFNGPPALGPPLDNTMSHNPDLYTLGCYDELVHYIQDHAIIIGVASIGAVVVMLFGLTFSVCLCRRVGYDYY